MVVAIVAIAILLLALILGGVLHLPGTGKSPNGHGTSPAHGLYGITFTESGLASGTAWQVELAGSLRGSTSSTLLFTEPNGTYAWTASASGYVATPASGRVTVSGGNQSAPVTFALPTAPEYGLTFNESGLPSGTAWQVNLTGAVHTSLGSSIRATEPNGTYAWTASASGYVASPASGTVVVSGQNLSVAIVFHLLPPEQHAVTFDESGLPVGTSWSVTLNGSTNRSTTTTVGFEIGAGQWSYEVGPVAGYISSPSTGNVTVAAASYSVVVLVVNFSATTTGVPALDNFSEALRLADTLAPAGSLAFLAAGIDFPQNFTETMTPELNASCVFSGGTGSYLPFPAWTGNYSSGYLTVWYFYLYSASPPPELYFIAVEGTQATLIGTLTQSSCLFEFPYATGVDGVLNSPTIASDLAANDSTYLATYPTATSEFAALSGFSYEGHVLSSPTWNVTFTTCLPSGGGTGHNFSATVNATSGVVEQSATYSGACASNLSPHAAGPRPFPAPPPTDGSVTPSAVVVPPARTD